ncbi:hypothetical protein HWV62_22800, partial [Athelia sp. TMB]
MAADNTNIPHIAVTTHSTTSLHSDPDDARTAYSPSLGPSPTSPLFPPTPSLQVPHARPSDPLLLSPFSAPRTGALSLDVPQRAHSPALSAAGSSVSVPPSPTLSASGSSVHFAPSTSLALRDNNPLLLVPGGHSRRPSWSSVATEADPAQSQGAEMAELGLHRAPSATGTVLSATHTHVEAPSVGGRSRSHSRAKTGSGDSTTVDHAPPSPTTAKHKSSHSAATTTVDHTPPAPKAEDEEEDDEARARKEKAALTPDDEADIGAFAFRPYALAAMLDPKDLAALGDLGGTSALLAGLGTDASQGLSPGPGHDRAEGEEGRGAFGADLEERRRVYGPNVLPHRVSKSLLQLMWLALKDKVLVLLSIAAVVSLALGLFQDFGTPQPPGQPKVDWVEGVAIMVAIAIVVIVGSVNDYQKERQFQALHDKKEERGVKVLRGGREALVDVRDVVVGDVCLLEPGEIVPVDGVFLGGHGVRCDESGATGESDAIAKLPYEECVARAARGESNAHTDCFVVSGSKVLEGVGRYVVVAVGTKSFNGRIMMALRTDAENTPLQLKLNALAELIAKLGSIAGLVLFVALMIRFFVQLGTGVPERTTNQKGIAFVQILIIAVTLIVVAVPEGLPLAVTLALAFATKRMTREKLLVRVLGSCETMANASVVCTDKTGTLTQNAMSVVAGSLGIHAKFVADLAGNAARSNAGDRKFPDDFALEQAALNGAAGPALRALFNEAVCVNSTAFEDEGEEGGRVFVGSKTETALLKFAKELGWADWKATREGAEVVQMIPFSSERKAMGVVVRRKDGGCRLYLKGASEILTKKCTRHVVVTRDGGEAAGEVETREIGVAERDNMTRTIIFYANQTLRTIALCYRDFESWPPAGEKTDENEVEYADLAQDLTLIAVVGIEDPLREGVREAVAKCHKAGVTIKMCTGDNVLTARSIALQCGIYTAGGIIMEGPIFRQLSDAEMLDVVPRLQVLARSSPEDKKILVERLRALGEIVGVTGDGTNDGPALKTADVGFSMGIAGTEVAKEASDIILMDDNFASIVKAIMWGRCVNDAVRKFLQFQVSTNVTAVVITLVTAIASTTESSVLSAVQLLWINIIMDTFAALALATDPASEALLDRKPDKKTAPLFSVEMYKQILFQSTYQIIITLIFHFLGLRILGYPSDATANQNTIVQTLVFNAFVFAQIFNSVNCRRLDNKLNIFEGLSRNYYFIAITLIEIAVQILIVFVGGAAFQVTHIGGREWGISLALGVVSIPLGALVRYMPNAPFERLFIRLHLLPNPEVLPTIKPGAGEWNSAINRVRDNLGLFSNVRGGRVRSSSFVIKSRSARLRDEGQRTTLPSLMAMVPTLVASSIGAGWTPQPGNLSDPASHDPSK